MADVLGCYPFDKAHTEVITILNNSVLLRRIFERFNITDDATIKSRILQHSQDIILNEEQLVSSQFPRISVLKESTVGDIYADGKPISRVVTFKIVFWFNSDSIGKTFNQSVGPVRYDDIQECLLDTFRDFRNFRATASEDEVLDDEFKVSGVAITLRKRYTIR